MTTIKLLLLFFLLVFFSCRQNNSYSKVDVRVARLTNKIIPLVNHINNLDSCKQALFYLDSATKIDNNCFLCHQNKLMFLYSLKQFDKAVETMNECIRISPSTYDLYLTGGILYEKVGDTISAKKYFQKSLTILNTVLDTIIIQDISYEMLLNNKAITLIMLGDNKAGNDLLKAIAYKQQEPELKEMTLSFTNKSKKQLVDMIINSKYSR